jgi:predicted RNA-binding Zn-ribbon protein involved in translation (DUF1610 family)
MQGAEMMENGAGQVAEGDRQVAEGGRRVSGRKRLHFLPADVLDTINKLYFDEDLCRSWILNRIHGVDIDCPACGFVPQGKMQRNLWLSKRVNCPACGKHFSAVTATFLSGTEFSFAEVYFLGLLLAFGRPVLEIVRVLDTDPGTVRLWKRKFENLELNEKI